MTLNERSKEVHTVCMLQTSNIATNHDLPHATTEMSNIPCIGHGTFYNLEVLAPALVDQNQTEHDVPRLLPRHADCAASAA